jgi:REP element-mobilizing transposase RayT
MYLEKLASCTRRFGFFVYAYCLMSNHVHLAIERGPVPVSRIMLVLQSSYAQFFNKRHNRVGHLFQGRYKAFLVDREMYLLALIRYIHLNPVKAGLVHRPSSYRWSSDASYRRGRGPEWLDVDRFLRMLAGRRSASIARYRRLIDGAEGPLYEEAEEIAAAIKGDEDFADRVLLEFGEPREPRPSWTIDDLVGVVASAHRLTPSDLIGRGKAIAAARARFVTAYLARREAAVPVSCVAKYFGRDESALGRGVIRLEALLNQDLRLRRQMDGILARLKAGRARLHG